MKDTFCRFSALLTSSIFPLIVVSSSLNLAPPARAQDAVAQDRETALKIATQMTTEQVTYYQKYKKFNTAVKDLAKSLDLTLPSTYNYGIRTSANAAYVYVMPAQTPSADKLIAYVGGAFIHPTQATEVVTIVCESIKAGRLRPSDPKLVKADSDDQATPFQLSCGESTAPVTPAKSSPITPPKSSKDSN